MATTNLGTVKLDVLLRLHGSDDAPHEVATVEVPLRAVRGATGKAQFSPDFGEFDRLGNRLAETLKEEWHG